MTPEQQTLMQQLNDPEYQKSCKKLYDMGVRLDTVFGIADDKEILYLPDYGISIFAIRKVIPAPTLQELLDVMPESYFKERNIGTTKEKVWYQFEFYKTGSNSYECGYMEYYFEPMGLDGDDEFADKNPCNAVAKCLIWLLENDYCHVVNGQVEVK